jgi:hypothetical protein
MPTGLTLTTAAHGGTGTSRDASAETEATGYVPNRRLHEILGHPRGSDFTWCDDSGIAVQDRSAAAGGPPTLVIRRDLLHRPPPLG